MTELEYNLQIIDEDEKIIAERIFRAVNIPRRGETIKILPYSKPHLETILDDYNRDQMKKAIEFHNSYHGTYNVIDINYETYLSDFCAGSYMKMPNIVVRNVETPRWIVPVD